MLSLDVTDAQSIGSAVAGPLDALVNNAGVGMLNVLQGADIGKVRELFDTNAIGAVAMAGVGRTLITASFFAGRIDRNAGGHANPGWRTATRA